MDLQFELSEILFYVILISVYLFLLYLPNLFTEQIIFDYINPFERKCKICGSHQQKYGFTVDDTGWWQEVQSHENNPFYDPDCECHKYHKPKEEIDAWN